MQESDYYDHPLPVSALLPDRGLWRACRESRLAIRYTYRKCHATFTATATTTTARPVPARELIPTHIIPQPIRDAFNQHYGRLTLLCNKGRELQFRLADLVVGLPVKYAAQLPPLDTFSDLFDVEGPDDAMLRLSLQVAVPDPEDDDALAYTMELGTDQ